MPAARTDAEGRRHPLRPGGRYLNPIVAGDHPDPTVLKDGLDYYMTFSSFQSYPGAVIWHSRDLVNWVPIVAALTRPIGVQAFAVNASGGPRPCWSTGTGWILADGTPLS